MERLVADDAAEVNQEEFSRVTGTSRSCVGGMRLFTLRNGIGFEGNLPLGWPSDCWLQTSLCHRGRSPSRPPTLQPLSLVFRLDNFFALAGNIHASRHLRWLTVGLDHRFRMSWRNGKEPILAPIRDSFCNCRMDPSAVPSLVYCERRGVRPLRLHLALCMDLAKAQEQTLVLVLTRSPGGAPAVSYSS